MLFLSPFFLFIVECLTIVFTTLHHGGESANGLSGWPGLASARLRVHAILDCFSVGRTRTFTSTRDPSRLMIDIRRSTVNRPRSALRMREKSAAAMPVRPIRGATQEFAGRAPFLGQFLAHHWRSTGGILGGLRRVRMGKFG
jgi:hypothetical protein